MKKFLFVVCSIAIVSLFACSNSVKVEKTTDESVATQTKETNTQELKNNESNNSKKTVNRMSEREFAFDSSVPFVYTGSDKYLKAITEDMLKIGEESFGGQGALLIPTPYIVKTDDSDKNNIKVYGDFYIFGYEMSGTIFHMKNGGSYPGCYYLKDDNGKISVIKREIAEDGSGNWSSLVKICSGDESLAKEVSGVASNDSADNNVRIEYVKMYAKANNLNVSGIKDFGWPIILFNDIDDAEFAYNFFNSYFDEIRDDNILNDFEERINRLKEKYLTKELIKKINDKSSEVGADMVINAQDVSDSMLDTLEAENLGNGNVTVSCDHGESSPTIAKVKIELQNGKKVITDIDYN